ncbi:MAG: hypothetical protein ABMA64_37915 [Myxococcota bacterium]
MNLSSGAFTVDDADDPELNGEGYIDSDIYRAAITMEADATGVMNNSNHTWYLNCSHGGTWGSVAVHLQGTYTSTP